MKMKMNEDYKEKINKLGKYTLTPIYLKNILEPTENNLFDVLQHLDNIKQQYISISMLSLYSSLSKSTILRAKKNLLNLDFVGVIKETKKGTVYRINYEQIYTLLSKLDEHTNIIKRLIICDEYREAKGLNKINEKLIEMHKETFADVDVEKANRKKPESGTSPGKPIKAGKKGKQSEQVERLLNALNEAQKLKDEADKANNISERDEQNMLIDSYKKQIEKNKIKITFDKNIRIWKTAS